MKVLVISDTHGNDTNFNDVWDKEKLVDYIIHCGDVEGRADYIRNKTPGPCCIVSGNCDFWGSLPPFVEFDIEGHHIFITHGHRQGVRQGFDGILRAARMHGAEIVCFGHSHVPVLEWQEGILLCNPGSLTYPRQFSRNPSYIVLEITESQIDGNIYEII